MRASHPETSGGPIRVCRGCGARYLKKNLLRFGVGNSGLLEVDVEKNLVGRGIYCCPRAECLALFVKKKGVLRKALRVDRVDCSLVENLIEDYESEDC